MSSLPEETIASTPSSESRPRSYSSDEKVASTTSSPSSLLLASCMKNLAQEEEEEEEEDIQMENENENDIEGAEDDILESVQLQESSAMIKNNENTTDVDKQDGNKKKKKKKQDEILFCQFYPNEKQINSSSVLSKCFEFYHDFTTIAVSSSSSSLSSSTPFAQKITQFKKKKTKKKKHITTNKHLKKKKTDQESLSSVGQQQQQQQQQPPHPTTTTHTDTTIDNDTEKKEEEQQQQQHIMNKSEKMLQSLLSPPSPPLHPIETPTTTTTDDDEGQHILSSSLFFGTDNDFKQQHQQKQDYKTQQQQQQKEQTPLFSDIDDGSNYNSIDSSAKQQQQQQQQQQLQWFNCSNEKDKLEKGWVWPLEYDSFLKQKQQQQPNLKCDLNEEEEKNENNFLPQQQKLKNKKDEVFGGKISIANNINNTQIQFNFSNMLYTIGNKRRLQEDQQCSSSSSSSSSKRKRGMEERENGVFSPYLTMVSHVTTTADDDDDEKSKENWLAKHTDLDLLYQAIPLQTKNDCFNENGTTINAQEEEFTLYKSMHPNLAPIITLDTLSSSSSSSSTSSTTPTTLEDKPITKTKAAKKTTPIITTYNITKTKYTSLHSLLHDENYWIQPLLPGFPGHVIEGVDDVNDDDNNNNNDENTSSSTTTTTTCQCRIPIKGRRNPHPTFLFHQSNTNNAFMNFQRETTQQVNQFLTTLGQDLSLDLNKKKKKKQQEKNDDEHDGKNNHQVNTSSTTTKTTTTTTTITKKSIIPSTETTETPTTTQTNNEKIIQTKTTTTIIRKQQQQQQQQHNNNKKHHPHHSHHPYPKFHLHSKKRHSKHHTPTQKKSTPSSSSSSTKKIIRKRYKTNATTRGHVLDVRARFFIMQLLRAVYYLHSKRIVCGDGVLNSECIWVNKEDGWVQLVLPVVGCRRCCEEEEEEDYCEEQQHENVGNEGNEEEEEVVKAEESDDLRQKTVLKKNDASKNNTAESTTNDDNDDDTPNYKHIRKGSSSGDNSSIPLHHHPGYHETFTERWRNGRISNLEYLLHVNAAAGRTIGDHNFQPILPWVTDFTTQITNPHHPSSGATGSTAGWRDLRKTKYRLHKTDIQLDQTFKHTTPPHHITEGMSHLTYTIYRARCTPIQYLRQVVRSNFIPEHYPASMEKLYKWTPDEATIEFYTETNPCIFHSLHKEKGMCDLNLPSWCHGEPIQFISYHRSLLEGDAVSKWLHIWIDLNFGEALSGERAIKEKNVVLNRILWDYNDVVDNEDGMDDDVDNINDTSSGSGCCSGECHISFGQNNTVTRRRGSNNLDVDDATIKDKFDSKLSLDGHELAPDVVEWSHRLESNDFDTSSSSHHNDGRDSSAVDASMPKRRNRMESEVLPAVQIEKHCNTNRRTSDFYQLFHEAHPRRLCGVNGRIFYRTSSGDSADNEETGYVDNAITMSKSDGSDSTSHTLREKLKENLETELDYQQQHETTEDVEEKVRITSEEEGDEEESNNDDDTSVVDDDASTSSSISEFEALKRKDLSRAGMILSEIYRVGRIIPPPVVSNVIHMLTYGSMNDDASRLLADDLDASGGSATSSMCPDDDSMASVTMNTISQLLFPGDFEVAYHTIAAVQCRSFERDSIFDSAAASGGGDKKSSIFMHSKHDYVESSALKKMRLVLQWGKTAETPNSSFGKMSTSSFALLLPTISSALGSIHPYVEDEFLHSRIHPDKVSSTASPKMSRLLPSFVETIGRCLGNTGTSTYLLPRILALIESALEERNKHATTFLQTILISSLLPSLYKNSRGEYFIKEAVPLLLRLLFTRMSCLKNDEYLDEYHDLDGLKKSVIVALTMLSQEDAMGVGLCCRYVVPALISRMNSKKYFDVFAFSASRSHGVFRDISDVIKVQEESTSMGATPLAQTFEALIPFLPAEAVDILICKPLLSVVIHSHLNLLRGNYTGSSEENENEASNLSPLIQKEMIEALGTMSALSQAVLVLRTCLPMIEQHSIMHNFFEKPHFSLEDFLLSSLSLAIETCDWNDTYVAAGNASLMVSNVDCSGNVPSSNEFTTDLSQRMRASRLTMLSEVGNLVCCLIRSVESNDFSWTIYPLVESYFSKLRNEYEPIFEQTESDEQTFSRNLLKNEALLLPGMDVGWCIFKEMDRVCPKGELIGACPSMSTVVIWISSLSQKHDLDTNVVEEGKLLEKDGNKESRKFRHLSIDLHENEPLLPKTVSELWDELDRVHDKRATDVNQSQDSTRKDSEISDIEAAGSTSDVDTSNHVALYESMHGTEMTSFQQYKIEVNSDIGDYQEGNSYEAPTKEPSATTEGIDSSNISSKQKNRKERLKNENARGFDTDDVCELSQVDSSFSLKIRSKKGISKPFSEKSGKSKGKSKGLKLFEHGESVTHKIQTKKKVIEWPWVVGLRPQWRQPWQRVGIPQQPQMIIWNSIRTTNQNDFPQSMRVHRRGRKKLDSIHCMAVNQSESLLAAGNGRGEILLWDLRCQPPQMKSAFGCSEHYVHAGESDHGVGNTSKLELNRHERMSVSLHGLNTIQRSKPVHLKPIVQLHMLDRDSRGVACDGNLHLWDAETNRIISSLREEPTSRLSAVLGGIFSAPSENFVAFEPSPLGAGAGEGIGDWGVTSGDIMGITSSRLYRIDLRCPPSDNHQCFYSPKLSRISDGIANHNPLYHSKTWFLNSEQSQLSALDTNTSGSTTSSHGSKNASNAMTYRNERSTARTTSFELTSVTVQCGGGNWVCIGSKSGHIHCFERRTGTLLHCWKGHNDAVVTMEAITRHKLLTISRDQTAILWNLNNLPEPTKLCTVRGLPDDGTNVNAQTVIAGRPSRGGILSSSLDSSSFMLHAGYGNKLKSATIPLAESKDIETTSRKFRNLSGKEVSKKELNIQSMSFLPLRELLLLGCDGEIFLSV